MAALGLWGLSRDSAMGNDESATHWAALLSLPQLGHLLAHIDAAHGLYYLLMHGWAVLGASPTIMRIPSVLAMTAAVALTVILGRRLTGSGWAGLLAGLIVALTPAISYYAQTARSYALVFACVVGATLALLHAMAAEEGGAARATGAVIGRRWLVYGALVTLAGYLNELSLLVLAAHAVTILLARYGRRAVAHWAVAAAAAAVAVAPVVVISGRETGAVSWIPRPTTATLMLLFHDYFGVAAVVSVLIIGCAVVAVLPPLGARRGGPATASAGPPGGAEADTTSAAPPPGAGLAWWRHGGFSAPSVAAPLLVVPAVGLILESLVARPFYVDRYVLYGEVGAALLAAAGACRVGQWLAARWLARQWLARQWLAARRLADPARRRALVWVPGVVVCLCALLLQLGPQQFVRTPDSRLFNFGGPARYVAGHARQGDGVLFLGAFYRTVRLGYPRDFRKTSDFALAVSPAKSGTFQGIDQPFKVTRLLMLQQRRIWVVGKSPAAALPAGLMRDEGRVLRNRYSRIAARRFHGVVVTLWLRR